MSTSPERQVIPLSAPCIGASAWIYVKDCLDTGWVSSAGAYVERFEAQTAAFVGARHAVATVNGTAALHIALAVAGVLPEDEVLVSALTFIAPANAIRYLNAWPIFVDAEPAYWQMDPNLVGHFLKHQCEWRSGELHNKSTGRRIGAILPVHILGHPVDLEPILGLARQYELPVIEDATESLGATYRGRPVGRLGDIACFSFNGNKLITTGGGGMIVTDNEAWARRARYLTTQAKDDPVEYTHNEVGFNYRLTNLQAALGCSQMEEVHEHVEAKRRIAARYTRSLAELPGIVPMREADWASSAYWLYTVLVREPISGKSSRDLLHGLRASQIETRPLWSPLHRSKAFRQLPPRDCPVADALAREALSLPCSVNLNAAAQDQVVNALQRLLAQRLLRTA